MIDAPVFAVVTPAASAAARRLTTAAKVQAVALDEGADVLGLADRTVTISCYHHQAIDRLGDGLTVVARADDGTVEAVVVDAPGWAAGVQWHPEDTWADDPSQVALVSAFVRAARR